MWSLTPVSKIKLWSGVQFLRYCPISNIILVGHLSGLQNILFFWNAITIWFCWHGLKTTVWNSKLFGVWIPDSGMVIRDIVNDPLLALIGSTIFCSRLLLPTTTAATVFLLGSEHSRILYWWLWHRSSSEKIKFTFWLLAHEANPGLDQTLLKTLQAIPTLSNINGRFSLNAIVG